MSVCFQRSPEKSQSGFTLLEVLVSIAIMGLVIGYFVNSRIDQMKVQLGENIAQDVMLLTNLATSYYVANSASSEWPGQSSTPACGNAMTRLESDGYLPSGYATNPAATITTSCSGGAVDSFDITIEFPVADADLARIVKTALPSAVELPVPPTATTRQVLQKVFPPRRAGRQYKFSRYKVKSGFAAGVPKPQCGAINAAAYIAIPQVICVHNDKGLQGYFFLDSPSSTVVDAWDITVCVGTIQPGGGPPTPPCGSSGPITYDRQVDKCNGHDAEIGVITYCK